MLPFVINLIKTNYKLMPGDEPHGQRLRVDCHVEFGPSPKDGRGTWFARAYDPD